MLPSFFEAGPFVEGDGIRGTGAVEAHCRLTDPTGKGARVLNRGAREGGRS